MTDPHDKSADKNQWMDEFLDFMKNHKVEPKQRKETRTPQQMMQDAIAHFESLNLEGVSIKPSESEWVLWFTGDTYRWREVLAQHGAIFDSRQRVWYYTASKRKRDK